MHALNRFSSLDLTFMYVHYGYRADRGEAVDLTFNANL